MMNKKFVLIGLLLSFAQTMSASDLEKALWKNEVSGSPTALDNFATAFSHDTDSLSPSSRQSGDEKCCGYSEAGADRFCSEVCPIITVVIFGTAIVVMVTVLVATNMNGSQLSAYAGS